MKTALGREFVRQIQAQFPDIGCYWLIARRTDRLQALAQALPGVSVKPVSLDLTADSAFSELEALLGQERPQVSLLINCAGCGMLGDFIDSDLSEQLRMVDLNIRALTAVTRLVLPYMAPGGRIINISVTTVCPGPMATEFLSVGRISGNSKTFDRLPYCDPVKVVRGALRASKARRAVYTPRGFYKFYRVLSGLVPTPSWSTPPRHKNRPARFLRERGIAVPGWGKREARRPPGSPGLRATRPGHGGMWACRPTRFGESAVKIPSLSGRPYRPPLHPRLRSFRRGGLHGRP